jgi:hypothetical protein
MEYITLEIAKLLPQLDASCTSNHDYQWFFDGETPIKLFTYDFLLKYVNKKYGVLLINDENLYNNLKNVINGN